MKWTVSSFTTEHLQQSLQHCNESISYDESTDYGGRSSATGNTHLPQHRDRCGRWVLTHLQQERTDFHVYGLPLQMCMWFYMTRQKYRQQGSMVNRVKGWNTNFHVYRKRKHFIKPTYSPVFKYTVSFVLTNMQTRQGKFINASRRIHELIKEFSRKHQRLFQKVLHLFKKVLSSISAIIL